MKILGNAYVILSTLVTSVIVLSVERVVMKTTDIASKRIGNFHFKKFNFKRLKHAKAN